MFHEAFEVALDAYIKSPIFKDVAKAIEDMLGKGKDLDNCEEELYQIIIKHPLRMCLDSLVFHQLQLCAMLTKESILFSAGINTSS